MGIASDILAAASAAIEALPISRDGTTRFLKHVTAMPFPDAGGGAEAFHIGVGIARPLTGFGLPGRAHREHVFYVMMGHPSFGIDAQREGWVADDVSRVSDAIERALYPEGTQAVFFIDTSTDKQRPGWWVTTMTFRAEFVELME